MNTAKASDTYLSHKKYIVNSGFTEKTKRDQLTIMNNVSGLADESKKSPSF